MERPYVWQIIKEAVEALGGKTTYSIKAPFSRCLVGDSAGAVVSFTGIYPNSSVNHSFSGLIALKVNDTLACQRTVAYES
jgi:hypothetical protein